MKSIKEVMSEDVAVCRKEDTLFDAASKMKKQNVGAIPVCSENKALLGMVTDRDLVLRGYAEKKFDTAAVEEVMSDKLYYVSSDASLQEASDMMAREQIRRLPIVENEKLAGIVSLGDLSLDDKSNVAAGKALEDISERPEIH
ncbi:CBS domain-containing protein [Lentibacillus amyloliquefaciens]|uniref:Inosine-5'-monophosphate dehydrogenase n=1 Tax=Lentibacillus amyloliquefaciens TaxID=1472767 RepID=A0A0U4F3R3_9BACI|nr:CBS domain-containing protein [Lentibacillus amyloliquefaciens]ALX47363.1 inosine-5'-monophosphate dehydrogenase [Lentibacillus amyloliquefaciens]